MNPSLGEFSKTMAQFPVPELVLYCKNTEKKSVSVLGPKKTFFPLP